MNTAHARLLADMMPEECAEVIRNFGTKDMDEIAGSTIDYLKEYRLIEHVRNILSGKFVWILTADGKKVRKCL